LSGAGRRRDAQRLEDGQTLRVAVTGATGLVGRPLVAALLAAGHEVTVLSREPQRAHARLGVPDGAAGVQAVRWSPAHEPAPAAALAGRDAVVNLAGENIARRWSAAAKRAIHDSRVTGTRNLVAGLGRCEPRPRMLLSASAVGFYGPHGEEPLDEESPPGRDFLAELCMAWETEAERASDLGVRVVRARTGIVLSARGGALAQMLTPFRLGLGGRIAGGRQYMSWIHIDDHVALLLAAIEDERFVGAVNSTAPAPVTNAEFTRALARTLHRPSPFAVPAFALRAVYGEMAQLLTTGARVLPARALMLGFDFTRPELDEALAAALAS
jgi:uncharacterized protein (TIGR01777 family)